jgi:hypothetical protein
MRQPSLVILGLLLVLVTSPAYPRTWYVKLDGTGDAPTIQAGIDSAVAGDDVLVAPGTYTWTNQGTSPQLGMIRLKSGVWLHSEAGPEVTVLDCEDIETVIWCSGVDDLATIEGFTITRGQRDGLPDAGGAGIHCNAASPTIRGNIITDNAAETVWGGAGGGGIYCSYSSAPLIEDNIISLNTSESYGGGIACWNSSPTITGNFLLADSASTEGGAIFIYSCDATISNNTIVASHSAVGAAIQIENDSATTIQSNIITGSSRGAALNCEGSGVALIECNDLWDNAGGDGNCTLGGDNFSADPMFCDAPAGDYHLHEDSPCAPGNSPAGCGQVGAFAVGCWAAPFSYIGIALATLGVGALGGLRLIASGARRRERLN